MSDPAARANLRFGWAAVCGFLLLGLLLETLHFLKAPFYVDARLRRELWTLAHAHGTLFGALNVLFALSAGSCLRGEQERRRAGRLLIGAGVLVPLGFFLGGIANAEGDPSPAIVLVPVGALLAIIALGRVALGARRAGRPPGA